MKKCLSIVLIFLSVIIFVSADQGEANNLSNGEFLKFRVHYGLLNAGYATLQLSSTTYNGKPHYHGVGLGESTGAVKLFFKVDDRYETYMDKSNLESSKFIRKINEGGYVRDQTMTINHSAKKIYYTDNRNNKTVTYNFTGQVHDMISAFYYLRNMDTDKYKTGDFIALNIFMDDELLNFRLKILGRETKSTKFGNIKCIKIRPYVLSGRVFKSKESVTIWVTDDINHVPVQIKADLAVGSLKADLDSYKNTKTNLNFQK